MNWSSSLPAIKLVLNYALVFGVLIRQERCWNGIVYQNFVDVVERKQSLRKLGDESNVQVNCAKRESILVLILYD